MARSQRTAPMDALTPDIDGSAPTPASDGAIRARVGLDGASMAGLGRACDDRREERVQIDVVGAALDTLDDDMVERAEVGRQLG
jgi:hypothetical protein